MIGIKSPSAIKRAIFPRYRKALKGPDRPVAIRHDYITDSKTRLVLRPEGDASSATAYYIVDDDDRIIFSVSGRKYSDRPCREFRDASGLPLFDLHRKIFSVRNAWTIALPGYDNVVVASCAPRAIWGSSSVNFSITFQNVAAADSKNEEDKKITLSIERYGNILATYDVVDGDRKIAEIQESLQHNDSLVLVTRTHSEFRDRGYRPAMDVTVAPGVDLSLIASIAVIASDWVFASSG